MSSNLFFNVQILIQPKLGLMQSVLGSLRFSTLPPPTKNKLKTKEAVFLCSVSWQLCNSVGKDGLKVTEFCLPLPLKYWVQRCVPPQLACVVLLFLITFILLFMLIYNPYHNLKNDTKFCAFFKVLLHLMHLDGSVQNV